MKIRHWKRNFSFSAVMLAVFTMLTLSCCTPEYEKISVDGTTRHYLIHVPDTLPVATNVPLVLALHQFSDTPRGMQQMTGFDELADREKFIVVYPEGRWRIWQSSVTDNERDIHFLLALIDALKLRYPVDPTRIYATGASAGAMMIQRLACYTSELAAIAPVMGSLSEDFREIAPTPTPLPVLVMHGREDPVIPYKGGIAGGPHASTFLSAEATADYWAKANGCTAEATLNATITDEDGQITAQQYRYPACGDNTVILYAVAGCGHSWPGHQSRYPAFIVGPSVEHPKASEVIWNFFKDKRNIVANE